MDDAENPAWYSILHASIVLLSALTLSLINYNVEHNRPKKKFIERSYRHNSGKNNVADSVENIVPIQASDTLSQKEDVKEEELNIVQKKEESKPQKTVVDDPESKLSNKAYFKKLVDQYKTEVLGKLDRPQSRSDVVIRYYSKPKDGNSVYALRKYGFYIHERDSDPSYDKYASNTIYYGDDVSDKDIQLIAYVLLMKGVHIKQIIPSRLHDDWKARSIEIGTDSLNLDLRTLQLSDLRKSWH